MKLNQTSGMLPAVVVAFCAAASTASANPTNLNPTAPLQAHGAIKGAKAGLEDAKAAVQRLYALHEKHEAFFVKAVALRESDPNRLQYTPLAKEAAALWKTLRDADQLQLMGEPAGTDLRIKLAPLLRSTGHMAFTTRNDPRVRIRIVDKLRKETQKRERILDQQQQKISNGQLEAAEAALESFGVELWEQMHILSPKEREPYLNRFQGLLADCDNRLNAKRKQLYLQQAQQLMTKNLEGVALFDSEATRIRGELSSTGTAKIGDNETASAADAIEYLTGLWGSASAGLIRNCGLRWAFSNSTASEISAAAQKPVEQLEASAKTAVIAMIESAAANVPAENVRPLYADILGKLSVIDRRMGTADVSKACEPALKKLAEKDPALPAQIAAYDRATGEALRWRESFALQQASQFRQSYVPTEMKGGQKVSIKESIKPSAYGSVSTAERVLLPTSFTQPASWTVSEVSPFLVEAKVSTNETVRISPKSKTSVVPFRSHQFANVAVGFELQQEWDALKAALNVDDEHPALSMAAADALSSSQLRRI